MTRGNPTCGKCGARKMQKKEISEQANDLMRLAEATSGPAGYGVSPAFHSMLAIYLKRAEILAVERVLSLNTMGYKMPDAVLDLRIEMENELKELENK